jgi:hypothetical protein
MDIPQGNDFPRDKYNHILIVLLMKLLGCVHWGNNVFSSGNTIIFLEDKCVLKNHFTTMGGDALKLLLYLK